MHRLEAEYWGEVDFVYLDREEPYNTDIVNQFGVRYQPVFILLDAEGNEIERWVYREEAELRQTLDSFLAQQN